ncbi:hypothetical protein VCHA53O466_140126 [Vibrio chagasii]|nr:hypothetical protein VCHA53O466_140126 [Vibrio chagasii]
MRLTEKFTELVYENNDGSLRATVNEGLSNGKPYLVTITVCDDQDYDYVHGNFTETMTTAEIESLVKKAFALAEQLNGKPPTKYGKKAIQLFK